jgi:SpoIIAA-like
VIERLEGMPDGTIGYRATGRLTREEYRDLLLPGVKAAAEAGDVRMVFAVGPGFERIELGALALDTKAGVMLGVGHPKAWKRTALVTDVDWLADVMHLFGWLTPGEVKLYGLDGLEDAKAWVAG